MRQTLGTLIRALGHEAITMADIVGARSVLTTREIDRVISDLRMPGGSGLDLFAFMRAETPNVPLIMLTAYGTVESAVQAMQQGAFDYLLKPFDTTEMELRIGRALALRQFQTEND